MARGGYQTSVLGDKRPSFPVASSAWPERSAPARADAGPGVVLVFGMTLRYVRAHGHPAELDGMPSLTQREQDLLHRYQRFYLDLVEGRQRPETDAQRRFLEVAAGRLPPVTEHERLWVRWRERSETGTFEQSSGGWGRTRPQAAQRQWAA